MSESLTGRIRLHHKLHVHHKRPFHCSKITTRPQNGSPIAANIPNGHFCLRDALKQKMFRLIQSSNHPSPIRGFFLVFDYFFFLRKVNNISCMTDCSNHDAKWRHLRSNRSCQVIGPKERQSMSIGLVLVSRLDSGSSIKRSTPNDHCEYKVNLYCLCIFERRFPSSTTECDGFLFYHIYRRITRYLRITTSKTHYNFSQAFIHTV